MAVHMTTGKLGQGMTLSVVPQYLLMLVAHWTIPFTLGFVAASVVATGGILSSVQMIDQSLDAALQRVVATCSTAAPEAAEISGATRSLFPLARGPTSPSGALVLALPSETRP
ncbi:MAG: hypothetical protein CMK74_20800 [Pseudomonadales bacterium]|nr:hypothetical protein [Pseudomonadales bacterium]|tara:strand:- start:6245 stop:6583 length:339 start_codon:yes stop_codon:yes gene_type:complete